MNGENRDDEFFDDAFARELLASLDGDQPEAPGALPDRTIRKVQAALTSRDLIDLTTFVFLMRFCAPLLDLFAAFFGHDPMAARESRSPEASRARSSAEPDRRSDPGDSRDE